MTAIKLPRCVEKLSPRRDGRTYVRCMRPIGHPSHCWANGLAWLVAGESQDVHSAPAPDDVCVPVSPSVRRTGAPQRPSQRPQRPSRGKRR